MKQTWRITIATMILVTTASSIAKAQADSENRSVLKGAAVEYLFPEQITIAAGKPAEVAMHFRVAPGLHINSHTPKEEFLIATSLAIPAGAGVDLADATYPQGEAFTLPSDPQEPLSVYTGEFVIQTKLVARPGDHLVEAMLHFQACDKSACMPPKSIKVPIDVIGK